MPTLIWVTGRMKMTNENRMMRETGTMIMSA